MRSVLNALAFYLTMMSIVIVIGILVSLGLL